MVPDDGVIVVDGFVGRRLRGGALRAKALQADSSQGVQAASAGGGASSSSFAAARVPGEKAKQAPALVVLLLNDLQEELRAYLFLFIEVACVGNLAPSCRQLCGSLWGDVAFWKVYAGVCLRSQPHSERASVLRDKFRCWLFHLEGDWARDFADFVAEGKRSEFGADFLQLLSDARYIVSGLMPCDERRLLDDFLDVLVSLLTEYSPMQLDERHAAESLVAKVERRSDVFTDEQVRRVATAFEESLEQALLEQHVEGAEETQFTEPFAESAWDTWDLEQDDPEESNPDNEFAFASWPVASAELGSDDEPDFFGQ